MNQEDKWTDLELDLSKTTLHGAIGAILCWYHDEENTPYDVEASAEGVGDELTPAQIKREQKSVNSSARKAQVKLGRLVGKITDIVELNFDKLNDEEVFDVYDALGSVGFDTGGIYKAFSEEDTRRCLSK